MKRRVVITGTGVVCPVGNDTAQTWENVKNGICGIGPITKYDTTDRKVKLAGEVKDFDPLKYMDAAEARKLDDYSIYAVAAAQQAFDEAGLEGSEESRQRWGVIMSSGIGGIDTIEKEHSRGLEKGFDRVSAYYIPKAISNMAAGNIAIRFGLKGMCSCVVSACASAANGIGDAFRNIRDGYADVMLAGGSEASVTELCIGGFTALKALSKSEDPQRASIPFDKERNGFVMGEGAAVLVLEEYEHARARGAVILGEVVGYAATCDAYHITALDPEANEASRCMELALEDAGIVPEDIDYINAHGTSTKINDECETKAIHKAFGGHAGKLKVSSTKSMTGHLLGASAAVEAVVTVKALQEEIAPPTAGLTQQDEMCDLDYVPGKCVKAPLKYAMSNSFGFGGHNVCLVFKRYE